MKRIVTLVVATIVLVLIVVLGFFRQPQAQGVATMSVPAPTTAAGYQKMFDSLNTDEWGGADVAISVPMGQRSVWLFGDTLSGYHGMVNSTAITQDGGSLHVSYGGNQLLPQADDDAQGRHVVYWIEGARKVGTNTIEVIVAPTWVSSDGQSGMGWGRETKLDRTGIITLRESGDVDFTRWTGWTTAPKLDTRFLGVKDGAPFQQTGVLFYGKRTHPEAHLAGGKTLVTICRNSITPAKLANGGVNYAAYRPYFTTN